MIRSPCTGNEPYKLAYEFISVLRLNPVRHAVSEFVQNGQRLPQPGVAALRKERLRQFQTLRGMKPLFIKKNFGVCKAGCHDRINLLFHKEVSLQDHKV